MTFNIKHIAQDKQIHCKKNFFNKIKITSPNQNFLLTGQVLDSRLQKQHYSEMSSQKLIKKCITQIMPVHCKKMLLLFT